MVRFANGYFFSRWFEKCWPRSCFEKLSEHIISTHDRRSRNGQHDVRLVPHGLEMEAVLLSVTQSLEAGRQDRRTIGARRDLCHSKKNGFFV